jgi:hypothetical protein
MVTASVTVLLRTSNSGAIAARSVDETPLQGSLHKLFLMAFVFTSFGVHRPSLLAECNLSL